MTMDSDSSPSIEVAIGNGAWRTIVTDPEAIARNAALAALSDPNAILAVWSSVDGGRHNGRVEISIRLTDDGEVREFNRRYRGQDKPTNVLSFPGVDVGSVLEPGQPLLLGDVIVAYETTVAEATEGECPVEAHLAHLIVHGILHLGGHDHEEDGEAARMEALESRILVDLGYADPYADTEPDEAAPTGSGGVGRVGTLEVSR